MESVANLIAVVEDASSFVVHGRTTFTFYVKASEVQNADTVVPGARYLLCICDQGVSYAEMAVLSLIRAGQTIIWEFDSLESDAGYLQFDAVRSVRNTARGLL